MTDATPVADRIPTARDLMKTTLAILKRASGEVSVAAMETELAESHRLSEAARGRPHGKGKRTELGYRAAWARTFLREKGLIESAGHAKWRATEAGRGADPENIL